MKIILLSDDAIRFVPEPGPMTIEAQSIEQQYSPFHMLASSLAFCTFSVLYSWATHAKLAADDLVIDVTWTFADGPHRVDSLQVRFEWPSLPPNRLRAAQRAAELCTVHATLMHSPAITIEAAGAPPASASEASTAAPPAGARAG